MGLVVQNLAFMAIFAVVNIANARIIPSSGRAVSSMKSWSAGPVAFCLVVQIALSGFNAEIQYVT